MLQKKFHDYIKFIQNKKNRGELTLKDKDQLRYNVGVFKFLGKRINHIRHEDKDYIVDSVYKVLGYLADFSKQFPKKQKPKGILVVWDIKRINETEQEIVIFSNDQVKTEIRKILEREIIT